jgi:hypothetical protein
MCGCDALCLFVEHLMRLQWFLVVGWWVHPTQELLACVWSSVT